MTKLWKQLAVALSFSFVCAVPAALAAGAKTNDSARTMTDAEFTKAAAQGGMAEVKLGELAEQKAANQAVKDFGQRMVKDHTQADQNLKTAAANENISLPTEMSSKDQATYDRLSKLSGPSFDRAYTRDMVRDHEADVAAFRHEASSGKDATIKSFASQTLPTLEDHLKQARETLQEVAPKASASLGK
jgi:putative membrane protein